MRIPYVIDNRTHKMAEVLNRLLRSMKETVHLIGLIVSASALGLVMYYADKRAKTKGDGNLLWSGPYCCTLSKKGAMIKLLPKKSRCKGSSCFESHIFPPGIRPLRPCFFNKIKVLSFHRETLFF